MFASLNVSLKKFKLHIILLNGCDIKINNIKIGLFFRQE